ncbi:MAG: ABC transporter ATP-binding protein/permease [Thermomicrobia bacterium]|nr:ABC transporter ATP-binding protein/permease [Thermomicrobia bacterium]
MAESFPRARTRDGRPVRPNQPETFRARARLAFQMIPKALALVWEATPRFATTNAILTVVQGVLPAITLYFSKAIVDGVINAFQVQTRAQTQYVLTLVALWFGVQLLASLLQTVSQLMTSLQSDLLSNYISVRLMEKANALDLSYFENAQFYDKLENARREAGYRPSQMVTQLFGLLRSTVTLVSVIGVLASLSWWLVLLVVAVSIPSFIYQAKYSGQFFTLLTGRAPDQRRLNYLSYLLTTDSPVKELRIFGLHGTLLERYRQIFATFYKENRDLTVRRTASQFALGALGTVVSGLTYIYVVLEVIAGHITVGGLTLYYQAFQQSQSQVSNILSGIGSTYENSLFLSNLFAFLAYAPELPVRANPIPVPTPIREGIVLDHVSFKYPGTEKWVVEDISFAIRPGETVALVGANGAGKTTLVKLLTRLYDPTEGRITIDGIDLRDFDPAALRSRVGVIFQDYVKYQLTAGENIGFGRIEAIADTGRIERSAVEAGADAVIAALPRGYETPLGRWFQDGQELSIGQWQKVALARAFMRDADLLILDEPTSSLDVRSEYEVFQAFGDLTEGKMAVLISHRFSTVRMAGRIVVIEDGRVIENGTHDELILHGGRYTELFDMQAASYR